MIRNLLIISLFFVFGQTAFCQHNQLYTLYLFNQLAYNPAYAGSQEALNFGAHYRHQWQGLAGAPRTATVFGHLPLSGGRSGLGLNLVSDRVGIFNNTLVNFNYAYRVSFKNDNKLSFGLSAQYDHVRFDWARIGIEQQIDNAIPYNEPSNSTMNFGFGVYYTGENFFIGASVPQLLRNAITSDAYADVNSLSKLRNHYLMGGYVFKLNSKIHIKPTILLSYLPNAPFEADFSLSVLFLDKLWVGGNYRLEESASAFLQFPVNQQLKIAAGVDYVLTDLNQYTKGSFEIMVEYLMVRNRKGVNNIRYF